MVISRLYFKLPSKRVASSPSSARHGGVRTWRMGRRKYCQLTEFGCRHHFEIDGMIGLDDGLAFNSKHTLPDIICKVVRRFQEVIGHYERGSCEMVLERVLMALA